MKLLCSIKCLLTRNLTKAYTLSALPELLYCIIKKHFLSYLANASGSFYSPVICNTAAEQLKRTGVDHQI